VPVTYSPAVHASLVGAMFGRCLVQASLLLGCVLRPAHKLFPATAEDEREYGRKWWCAVGVGVALVLDACVGGNCLGARNRLSLAAPLLGAGGARRARGLGGGWIDGVCAFVGV